MKRPIAIRQFKFAAKGVEIKASAGEGKMPTVDVVAYNGGPLMVEGYDVPVIISIAGVSVERDVVLNLHHDKTQIVGHVPTEGVELTATSIILHGLISGTGPAAAEAVGNAKNQFPWQASVEATPVAGKLEFFDQGQSVSVNGQTFTGPCVVAWESLLHGTAFVARGADDTTTVAIAASAANQVKGAATMPTFEEWCASMGFAPTTDEQKAAAMKQYEAIVASAGGSDPPEKTPVAAAAWDASEIRAAHDESKTQLDLVLIEAESDIDGKKFAEIRAAATKKINGIRAAAIKEKWDSGKYQIEATKAICDVKLDIATAKAPAGPAIHASRKDYGKDEGKVIEAAMCRNLGLSIEKGYSEEVQEAASSREMRGFGLHQLLIHAASKNGFHCRAGEGIHAGNLEEVLRFAFPPRQIQAASSYANVSGILSNIANKEIMEGYNAEPQSWRELGRIKTVKNFQAHTSYLMLDNLEYELVGQDGIIKHGDLGEESYTRAVDTYAKMFALNRKQIINDDLGAFNDLQSRLGRGSARKLNKLFWSTFLSAISGGAFFTSGRGNYITGSTTTLLNDAVGLALAVKAFRQLKTPTLNGVAGTLLDLKPEILLVSENQEVAAEELYTSTNFNTGGSATKEKVANNNIYKGKFRPVVVPQIADSSYTGYSTTHWGLFCNPSVMAAVDVSFLNGNQSPTVDQTDADFNTLGIQMRGYHDFGVDMAEYLAGVWSKGAA